MKGHMEDGKFHPHKPYKKGVRKSRDQSSKFVGLKIARDERARQQLKGAPKNIKICSTCDRSFDINKQKGKDFVFSMELPQCTNCKRKGVPPLGQRKKLDDSQKTILSNWVKKNPNWTTIDDLPNDIFVPLVAPAKDDTDERVAIQKEAIDFMKQVTKDLNKDRKKRFLSERDIDRLSNTELNAIFKDVEKRWESKRGQTNLEGDGFYMIYQNKESPEYTFEIHPLTDTVEAEPPDHPEDEEFDAWYWFPAKKGKAIWNSPSTISATGGYTRDDAIREFKKEFILYDQEFSE